MSGQHAPIQANAATVVDWYRTRLAEATHDLAFAQCALAESQHAVASLNTDLGAVRGELDTVMERLEGMLVLADPPDPQSEGFGAWVVKHWATIEDARLAFLVDHPEQPHVLEQP